MNTLQEYYAKQKIIKKINNIEVITEELDQLLAEGFDEQELDKIETFLDTIQDIANKWNLTTLGKAIKSAYETVIDSSGMMGLGSKLKSLNPFVDGMSKVVSFQYSVLNFLQSFPSILKTVVGKNNLTDEQKNAPIDTIIGPDVDEKSWQQFTKAIRTSLESENMFSRAVNGIPWMNDTDIAEMCADISTHSYNDLLEFTKTTPSKLPVDKEDAQDLAAAAAGDEESIDDIIDKSSKGGEVKGDESAGDISPSDEVDKISDSSTSPKAAITSALNSWVNSDEVLKKAFSDDPAITSDMKNGIYNAIDKAADGMASEIDKAMKAWFKKHGSPLVMKGLPNKPFGELIDTIGNEVAELIKKQKAESTKYTVSHSQIKSIVNKRLNKKYFNIL